MNGDTLDGVNGSFWEEAQSRGNLMAIEPEVMYNNYEERTQSFWLKHLQLDSKRLVNFVLT